MNGEALLRERWDRYRAAGHWQGQRMDELAAGALERTPGLRLLTYGAELPLAEATEAAARLAERLGEAGIGEGTRVFVLVSDALGDVVLLLALSRLDAVIFMAPPGQALEETGRMLDRCGARAVVCASAGRGQARAVAGLVPSVATIVASWPDGAVAVEGADAIGQEARPGAERVAPPTRFVTFTSGTTGEPKGIQHDHDTLRYAGRHLLEAAGPLPGAVLALVSVAHAAGLASSLMSAFVHGRDLALHFGRWNPGRVLELIEASGAAYTMCTPTHILDVLAEARARDVSLDRLTASVGGAPVTPALVGQADSAGVTICRIFGMSECPGHTSTNRSDPLELRMRTEGRSFPGTDDVSLDADGRPVPPGETGELACRGPSLFFGYLGEGMLDRLTPDGYFRTGDLVRIEEGLVTVEGRLKDIVIRGGDNIDPVEVEALLLQAEGVARVAVLGVPDPRLGERLAAAVQPDPGHEISPAMLVEHLAGAGVPRFKWPERWRIVDALPTNATGKVDKKLIREAIQEGEDAAVHQHRA